jgi:hypothetical protein
VGVAIREIHAVRLFEVNFLGEYPRGPNVAAKPDTAEEHLTVPFSLSPVATPQTSVVLATSAATAFVILMATFVASLSSVSVLAHDTLLCLFLAYHIAKN